MEAASPSKMASGGLFAGLNEKTPKTSNVQSERPTDTPPLPPVPVLQSNGNGSMSPSLNRAPVTDKLLGLLGEEEGGSSGADPLGAPPPSPKVPRVLQKPVTPEPEAPAPTGSWFGGWFGGSTPEPPVAVARAPPAMPEQPIVVEKRAAPVEPKRPPVEKDPAPASSKGDQYVPPGPPAEKVTPVMDSKAAEPIHSAPVESEPEVVEETPVASKPEPVEPESSTTVEQTPEEAPIEPALVEETPVVPEPIEQTPEPEPEPEAPVEESPVQETPVTSEPEPEPEVVVEETAAAEPEPEPEVVVEETSAAEPEPAPEPPVVESEPIVETSEEVPAEPEAEPDENGESHKLEEPSTDAPTETENGTTEDDKSVSSKKEVEEASRQALEAAFDSSERSEEEVDVRPVVQPSPSRPTHRGPGEVHVDTPVPNPDVALRVFRKFASKTRPKISTTYGGAKSNSIIGYLFGSSKEDPNLVPFRALMDALYDEGEDRDAKDESDLVVDMVLGESGDSVAKARRCIAAFVHLFGVWCHASHRFFESQDLKSQQTFSEWLQVSLDTASSLAAHGCLDGVLIGVGGDMSEYHRAINMLAQSVFNADLSLDANELAAIKFLLGTGCRVATDGDALLRGSHLLQTIRLFYHVYLTTDSVANKTTARAALQQLVTSVFSRLVQYDSEWEDPSKSRTVDNFPSEHHRDAFLVLRSICKLSMRSLPSEESGMHSHIGLQASGSYDAWDGEKMSPTHERPEKVDLTPQAASLIYTTAIHPALESKLLALELILYVLGHTDFSGDFIHRSGSQFHAAIRNYLCVSLLKNCTSDDTRVVNLSLRIFVPLMRNFRTILKNEIEAFVTNVFFVILDSKNSPAEHKSIVVKTFAAICSDPEALAEIFLNYDCDLSAVDLFHRIVNTLSRVARTGMQEPKSSALSFMGGASAARMEKFRNENRDLRLDAMRALRSVLASLHGSMGSTTVVEDGAKEEVEKSGVPVEADKQTLVEIYDSKKKKRAEESEIILKFNQKPSAGIKHAAKCKHIDDSDPADVARYLLKNKDNFEKTMIGEYLGREVDYQEGFATKVLHEYVRSMDLAGLEFDEAIRYFLSGFRLPGEAQKIDRIMEKFAERFTEQNPEVFPTADVAFILAFSIIMLNTDLHNPAIKEERRMTKQGFIRNNRGINDGKDLPEDFLLGIFDRIKTSPISLKEDDEARERTADPNKNATTAGMFDPGTFFSSHFSEMDRARESNFQKERDHIVRTTESILKRRRPTADSGKHTPSKPKAEKPNKTPTRFVRTEESGLRDEYVKPMFEVTWGPALAAFATAIESGNGTEGALIAIASDEELEMAVENAAETIEVCLTGFRFAICTAGLCGNETARDAYMIALSRFSQLGTGLLLGPRHIRCMQTMLGIAREDGELLGSSWEHVFTALSEINRFHQLLQLMARNDRAAASAANRRRSLLEDREKRRKKMAERKEALESDASFSEDADDYASDDSLAESDLFEDDDFTSPEDMDAKAIDEANARAVYDAVSEAVIETIYERSSTLSTPAVKEFIAQLCQVSRSEISVGAGKGGKELTQVSYRQQHALLNNTGGEGMRENQFHHTQPNIFSLQKLVEVTHYNMETRPRLIFAELWTTVADHLTRTSLHSSPAIAMYAVDSFRQLSIQYLQRDELEVFEFQKRFLKPLETVMSESAQTSTKELLLDCIDRIIQVFRTDRSSDAKKKGGLRSGWLPILTILGLAGADENPGIADMSFRILAGELMSCLKTDAYIPVLLSDYFVETTRALFMFVGGPHEKTSVRALDQLMELVQFLGDDASIQPQLKRRSSHEPVKGASSKQDLELWWPILLGLSRVAGDERPNLRSKGLLALENTIKRYFVPHTTAATTESDEASEEVQTLQLIFRGVLTPMLEFAETSSDGITPPSLPEEFDRLLTAPKPKPEGAAEEEEDFEPTGWMETTFDRFLDMCVSICLLSIKKLGESGLIDEIFAILNSCLLSDSGALAVKGIRRLDQFISSDLDPSVLTDDLWATVSHMLRRCLTIRGLPRPPSSDGKTDGPLSEEAKMEEAEYSESLQDFIAEERFLAEKRYAGSNAAMVVGQILTSERFAVDLRWRLFLIAAVGTGIADWERAASLLGPTVKSDAHSTVPPDYRENALYGRKLMNRFLLQLTAIEEIATAPSPDADNANRFSAGKKLVVDEIQRLLNSFLEKENVAAQYRHTEEDEKICERFKAIVKELLNGLLSMDGDHLRSLAWINPVLLSTCIQSKNEDIRMSVQKLVQRTSPGSDTPYPMPTRPAKVDEQPTTSSPPQVEADPLAAAPTKESDIPDQSTVQE